jgi:hypothetical protein
MITPCYIKHNKKKIIIIKRGGNNFSFPHTTVFYTRDLILCLGINQVNYPHLCLFLLFLTSTYPFVARECSGQHVWTFSDLLLGKRFLCRIGEIICHLEIQERGDH